jgi:hypothetical protein
MMSNSNSSDTSGSGSGSGSDYGSGSGSLEASSELVSKTTGKVGGQSTLSDSLSADSGSWTMSAPAVSGASPKRLKPMDRDEKMAYLEDMINRPRMRPLVSLSNRNKALADQRRALRELPESIRIGLQLKDIEEDLTAMRKREDRLVAEIARAKDRVESAETS